MHLRSTNSARFFGGLALCKQHATSSTPATCTSIAKLHNGIQVQVNLFDRMGGQHLSMPPNKDAVEEDQAPTEPFLGLSSRNASWRLVKNKFQTRATKFVTTRSTCSGPSALSSWPVEKRTNHQQTKICLSLPTPSRPTLYRLLLQQLRASCPCLVHDLAEPRLRPEDHLRRTDSASQEVGRSPKQVSKATQACR